MLLNITWLPVTPAWAAMSWDLIGNCLKYLCAQLLACLWMKRQIAQSESINQTVHRMVRPSQVRLLICILMKIIYQLPTVTSRQSIKITLRQPQWQGPSSSCRWNTSFPPAFLSLLNPPFAANWYPSIHLQSTIPPKCISLSPLLSVLFFSLSFFTWSETLSEEKRESLLDSLLPRNWPYCAFDLNQGWYVCPREIHSTDWPRVPLRKSPRRWWILALLEVSRSTVALPSTGSVVALACCEWDRPECLSTVECVEYKYFLLL